MIAITPINSIDELRPGDQVRVNWVKNLTHGVRECYPKEGVVVQATKKFVAIRSLGGFVFCVGAYDLVCGVTVVRKGAA